MGAAIAQINNMMYVGSGRQPAVLLARLAERVRGKEALPDVLPVATVTFLGFGIASVTFVTLILLLGVFLTKPTVS